MLVFYFQRSAGRSTLPPTLQRVGEEEIADLSRCVEETLQLSTRNAAVEAMVSSRAQLLELFADPAIVVNSIVEQDDTDESLLVSYQNSEEFVEGGQATNVVIASFVTCWARLKLYGLISKLGTQCLYFDTDSCIYLVRGDGNDYIPPRGEALGQLKSELSPDNYITDFCSSRPKSYSYVLKNPEG